MATKTSQETKASETASKAIYHEVSELDPRQSEVKMLTPMGLSSYILILYQQAAFLQAREHFCCCWWPRCRTQDSQRYFRVLTSKEVVSRRMEHCSPAASALLLHPLHGTQHLPKHLGHLPCAAGSVSAWDWGFAHACLRGTAWHTAAERCGRAQSRDWQTQRRLLQPEDPRRYVHWKP